MSWKDSKVLLLPHEESLRALKVVEHHKHEDIRDLYLLGQAAEQVSALRPQLSEVPTTSLQQFYVRASSPSPLRQQQNVVKIEVVDHSVMDATAMPPPPPPPPPLRQTSTSPTTNVSSTSEDGLLSVQEKIQIGKAAIHSNR